MSIRGRIGIGAVIVAGGMMYETNSWVCVREFRTIHGMVYNALKMFMEINPELFEEAMQQ